MSWHYLQERGAASSEACCTGGEPLAQLKSKTTHAEFYCNGKLTESYLRSLSGTTSAPLESTTKSVPSSSKQCKESENSLLSQADSHAKTSQLQEQGQESRGQNQDSGQKWHELFVRYDLERRTWRTHQCLFQEDLPWSSVTLPKWGMLQNGVCWELINWEDGISAIESGLERQVFPTPTTMDKLPPKSESALKKEATQARPGRNKPANLRDCVHPHQIEAWDNHQKKQRQMWHTPTTTASKQYEKRYPDGGVRKHPIPNLNAEVEEGIPYSEQVKNRLKFPTPTVSDVEGGIVKNVELHEGSFSRKNKEGVRWGVKLRDAIHHLEDKKLYPTPTCQECEHPDATLTDTGRRLSKDGNSSHSLNLSDTVKKYPTPAARDYKGVRLPDTIARTGRNPETNSLPDCVENKAESTAVLNPDWVEWLMGWPIGWTDLKPLSREAFNQWKESVIDGSFWREDIADISDIDRVTTKKTDRVARLKAIGNGQVAICATVAWPLLKTSE